VGAPIPRGRGESPARQHPATLRADIAERATTRHGSSRRIRTVLRARAAPHGHVARRGHVLGGPAMGDEGPSVLPPGTRIDQYVISGVLGRGGFGITYLVRDEGLDKDFALKEFFPEDLVLREGTQLRFATKPNSEADYKWGLRKFYDEA